MIKYSSGFPLDILDRGRTFPEMIGNVCLTSVKYQERDST